MLGRVLLSSFYMKRLPFLHCTFLPLLLGNCRCVGLSLAFNSVPLICISVVPEPYFFDDCSFSVQYEVRESESSSSIFLKIALTIRGVLCFYKNWEIFCSNSMKNTIGDLLWIALNLYVALDRIFNLYFHNIESSSQEHGISFHLSSLIFFINILQFSEYRFFAS